jgi:riboflavin biosynthesis pyrimidine reductase
MCHVFAVAPFEGQFAFAEVSPDFVDAVASVLTWVAQAFVQLGLVNLAVFPAVSKHTVAFVVSEGGSVLARVLVHGGVVDQAAAFVMRHL